MNTNKLCIFDQLSGHSFSASEAEEGVSNSHNLRLLFLSNGYKKVQNPQILHRYKCVACGSGKIFPQIKSTHNVAKEPIQPIPSSH